MGTWALVWTPLRKLHEPFRAVDITRESSEGFEQLPIFLELQAAHASLMARYERVAAAHERYDRHVFDYCKEGLAHYRFHPEGLPERDTLLPLAAFDSGREHLQNAQRRFSQIISHAAWLDFWNELQAPGVARREAVRFIAVSQPHAGDVLNAIPMRREFRVPSWAMRIIVQRRLGLPLDEALARGAPTCTARGGRVQDPMGDAASNIGRAGHNQRHKHVLHRLVLCMQSVWGRLVEEEPQDHMGYSNDYRPDVTAPGLGRGGKRLVGDVKLKDPLSSNPGDIERRGGFVGFGCTAPATRADIYGLAQRGVKGDGNFQPGNGGGYVAAKRADYDHALSRGDTDVQMLLFETFGGWSPPVVALFKKMRDKVQNKLTKKQYEDEVTWSTRTWQALMAQRMSVSLHLAVAWEIAVELKGVGAEEDEAALFGAAASGA